MRITALLTLPLAWASASQHAARVWALRNTISLETGWRMFSVGFYGDENCVDELVPEQYLDGGHLKDNQVSFSADAAFDDKSLTVWVAQCGRDSTTGQPCAPYEAWIGADFGSPVVVYCVKVCQSKGATGSPQITLSKEGTSASSDGSLWVDIKIWNGLPSTAECVALQSGISKLSSISYAPPLRSTHCAQQAFGLSFTSYAAAKASCDLSQECVGIYDQECGPMFADVTFRQEDRNKWNRFFNNLDSENTLQSPFNDDQTIIMAGSTVAPDEQRLTAEAPLPRTIRVNLMAIGQLKLCGELPDETPLSAEGSCLHLKTGALLEFILTPNTRGVAELMQIQTVVYVEECAEACIALADCKSFLQVHKKAGDDLTENNCHLQSVVTSTEALDGSIDIADLYIKKGLQAATNETGTMTTDTKEGGSHAAPLALWGALACLLV